MKFAAVEGGGTSWVAVIAEGTPDNIVERADFPTELPAVTLGKIREWLKSRTFDAIGIATFGPVDAVQSSPTYGYITSTPKPNWGNVNVLGLLGIREFGKPFKFDTDVNAPALAEFLRNQRLDASLSSSAYITVGTGVGVGLVVNGQTVHGLLHPEAGHVMVAKLPGDDFSGTCPFHGACIEGLCSSGATAARKGCDPSALATLSDDDDVWHKLSYYLAQLCANLVLIVSPQRIILGGGVMNRESLFPKVRSHLKSILNNYISSPSLTDEGLLKFVGPSVWGSNAGVVGALHLAMFSIVPSPSSGSSSSAPPPPPSTATRPPNPQATKWPEALNLPAEEAKALILRDRPRLSVVTVPAGAMVTMDHRLDRVRLFVDSSGKVVRSPRLG